LIGLWIDEGELLGEILADAPKYFEYEVYESNHSFTHEYWGAYLRHNKIRRSICDMDQNQIDDIFVTENHALMMYEPFITTQV
jgi:vancomycin resistance protein VanW